MLFTIRALFGKAAWPLFFTLSVGNSLETHPSQQDPLQNPSITRNYGLPLSAEWLDLTLFTYYTALIGVGEPPQLMKVGIDTSWAGMFMASTLCGSDCAGGSVFFYNHSQSSTYRENGTAAEMEWNYSPVIQGTLSYDTLSLGAHLTIPDAIFIEAVHSSSWLAHGLPGSILGLSPGDRNRIDGKPTSNISLPSVFEEYMALNKRHNLSKSNSFSLLAPYPGKHAGDLSFGTSHADFHDGELVKHKLYPDTTQSWTLKAPAIKMRDRNGTVLFAHDMEGYTAKINSALPGISIPSRAGVWKHIQAATGAGPAPGCSPLTAIDCGLVTSMPELVLDFDGQEIVLKGEDYFIETPGNLPFCNWGPFCVIVVGEHMWERDDEFQVSLGTDFLKMVYAVFDWDDRSISFAKANRKVV